MSAKVIAIDGPAYVGKSQIAKDLAARLGYTFINTGHMYRALARKTLEQKINPSDEARILQIPFRVWFEKGRTMVAGPGSAAADWTDELDRVEIVQCASKIAVLSGVREKLTAMQRSYPEKNWIVMEGRDIGTVVFPDAEWKFFVTASEEVRAARLLKMLSPEERQSIDFPRALEKIRQIDDSDKNRKIAPLRKAEDAFQYDNSDSPNAHEDADEIHRCIQLGKAKAPKNFAYGIHR